MYFSVVSTLNAKYSSMDDVVRYVREVGNRRAVASASISPHERREPSETLVRHLLQERLKYHISLCIPGVGSKHWRAAASAYIKAMT